MGMRPHSSSSSAAIHRVLEPTGRVGITYLDLNEIGRWLTTSETYPLAVVSFGQALPVSLPCPVIQLDLEALDGPGRCEVWSCDQPVRFHTNPDISLAMTDSFLFGSITLPEEAYAGLAHATETAYRHLLLQLRESGFPYLWRIWNYFPRINEEQRGLERYRQFCLGRHEALAHALPGFPGSLPAATAVGTHSGPLHVMFLAGAHPAQHLGNPRQVNAYEYPQIYGPCSPSFARATLHRSDSTTHLFISGTASVVGHESQHQGLPDMQARETVRNLRALLERGQWIPACVGRDRRLSSVFKVYVRNPDHLDSVRGILDDPLFASSRLLFLRADLCRKELLVEIEGLVTAA
jgi:chorismate lyase / 3-hydroxybenzoate synthase